jgi:hypothetical protein
MRSQMRKGAFAIIRNQILDCVRHIIGIGSNYTAISAVLWLIVPQVSESLSDPASLETQKTHRANPSGGGLQIKCASNYSTTAHGAT